MCGLVVETEGDSVTSIRGDEADTFSRGHLCPKAVALQDVHADPDRIRTPLIREGSTFREASWDEALDLVATRLHAIRRDLGNNAVGIYLGNPSVHNWGMATHAGFFFQYLKTKNRYSASSVDQLPMQLVCYFLYGHQMLVPVADLDRTDHLLMIGANPVASNGSMMSAPDVRKRILAIRERGGRVVVLDPRRTETAAIADEHHFVRPGADALFLLAFLAQMFEEGLVRPGRLEPMLTGLEIVRASVAEFTPERVAPVVGIEAADIRRIVRSFCASPRAALYGRMGISTQPFGALCQWAMQLVNILSGNLDREGGTMFTKPAVDLVAGPGNKPGHFDAWRSRVSGRPEWAGELPAVALAEEMLTPGDGQIRAFVTGAGNPVLSVPNGRKMDDALASLEFMVSIDFYLNETTRHAHVILPPTSPLEHDHYDMALSMFSIRNVARYSEAVFPKPDGAMHDWEIFLALGRRMAALADAKPPPDVTPTQILDAGLAVGPYGAAVGSPRALTTDVLRGAPHGVDLGALEPCLPDRIVHADKRLPLAVDRILSDLPRVRALLEGHDASSDELLLIGRRHLRSNNSWMHNSERLMKGASRHQLLMHPADLESRGLVDGARVSVTSRVGSIEVEVRATDDVMQGVVSLPHGFGHDRPGVRLRVAEKRAGVSVNDLTDERFVDELSANAAVNGVPVRVASAALSVARARARARA